jgi:hypothetical protein
MDAGPGCTGSLRNGALQSEKRAIGRSGFCWRSIDEAAQADGLLYRVHIHGVHMSTTLTFIPAQVECELRQLRRRPSFPALRPELPDPIGFSRCMILYFVVLRLLSRFRNLRIEMMRTSEPPHYCPDSEVRIIVRRSRLRTSESKDTSKFDSSAALGSEVRMTNLRIEMMRTSEPPH